MKTRLLLLCCLCFTLSPDPARAQELNGKAARYLEPLLKRPGSGPLFDRFVDAWLDTGTLEGLEKYLTEKVKAEETTPNRLLLAVYLSRQGETVRALEQFRAALAKDPGSADIWYQKAVVEARTLDFDNAIASLRKALEAKPAAALSLQASQLLGRLLARSGQTTEALKVWEELMAARPDDEDLREDVLELQIAEGLHAAAIATAESLVENAKDPYKRVLRRLRLGDIYDRAGSRDKALEAYVACLAESGADSWLEKEITAQIEKLFRREDDVPGLKNFYGKLLEKDGRRLGLRRAQARLLVELNEADAAVASGRELLKLAPGDRTVRDEFIALLAGANKLPEAIAQLEELRRQSPNDAELLLRLALLQNDAGKKPEALALVREFVKLSGDEASRLRASGLLERCGLPDEAAAILREGGDTTALQQALASVLHKNGKKDEALAEWKKLAGGGTVAALEAARALTAHGELDAAWQLLKEKAAGAENDQAFLTALCQAAEKAEHAAEALPFVRKLAGRATLPADLETALDLAVKLARTAGQVESLTAELQANAASAQDFALLASLREEARDSAGAEAALRKAEAASPELAVALLAKLYAQRADFYQAAQAMERLYNSEGGRKAHYAQSLTDLWMRSGMTDNALKSAREWRRLAPGSTAPVLAEARLLEAAGRDADSLEVLRRAAGQFENNDDVRAQLAASYRASGRTADALRIYASLYENAADLPTKMRWMQPWAQTAEEAGRTQELIEQFEDRRRASRDSIVPLLALAEIHRASDSYDGRRKALTEAARLKPNDPELALEIARLEAREDNEDAAIRTLRAALPNDKSGTVRQDLVMLLLRGGERDEGLRLLAEGQADALQNPSVVEKVADSLLVRDSPETALAFLAPHLSAHPDDYRLQFLAAHLEREENPEAAAGRLGRVLDIRAELSDARRKAFLATALPRDDDDAILELVSKIAPPRAAELFSLMAATQQFTRRQGQYQSGGRRGGQMRLPESLEEARLAAAALLISIAGDDEEKTAAALTQLERAGFGCASLLRTAGVETLQDIYSSGTSQRLAELSAANPDDDSLLALAAMGQLFDWEQPGSPEVAGQIWKRYGKERLPLALMGALPAIGGAENPAPWEEEVLRAAEAVTKPEPMLLYAPVRVLGLPYGDQGARPDVKPAVKQRVIAIMKRWYAGSDLRGKFMAQASSMIFVTLANAFAEAGDAAGFARLLDEEAVRPSGAVPVSFSPFSGRQRPGAVSQPLGFPPRGVSLGVSPTVAGLLSPGSDEFEMFSRKSMSEDSLREVVQAVTHPIVKLLLTVRNGDDAAAEKLIASRLAADQPDALTYLLGAAWAERQSDFPAAVELARKALYLPLSKEIRKVLDSAFLAWADRDSTSETVVTAAREAALRMRRDVLTSDARAQLAAIMDGLGLTSEAEKLAKQDAVAGGAAGGAVVGGIVGRGSTPVITSQSGRLLAAGKKEEAMPLLTRELLAFGREALKEDGWNSVRGFDEWFSTLKQFALTDPVMKSAVPANGDAKVLAVWGAALDLTGDGKQAVEIFRRALAAGSKDPGVKARLFRRIAPAAPQEAAALLKGIPQNSRDAVFALLLPDRNDYNGNRRRHWSGGRRFFSNDGSEIGSLESFIDAAEVLEAFLGSLTAEEIAREGWFSDTLDTLASEAGIDESWAAAALDSKEWETPKDTSEEDNAPPGRKRPPPPGEPEARARINARAQIYGRIVDKLMATPGTACQGWQALQSLQKSGEDEAMPEKVFTAGIAAALRDIGSQKKASTEWQDWHGVFNSLVPDAVRSNRLAELETKLLPEVRRMTKGKPLEQIEQMWLLHRCAPQEFPARAKEIALKSRGESWETVLSAARVRKTGAEVADDFLAWLAPRVVANTDLSSAREAFASGARLIADIKGRAAAEQWLITAWERIAGSREERIKLMEGMDEDDNFEGNRARAVHLMVYIHTALFDDSKLLFPALRTYESEYINCMPVRRRSGKWERLENDLQRRAAEFATLIKEKKTNEVLAFLAESPFQAEAAGFRTFGDEDGLFRRVADALGEADRSLQAQVAGSPATPTFGQALLTAAMAKNRGVAVCNAMSSRRKDIAAMPQAQRLDLRAVLTNMVDFRGGVPPGLTKDGEDFRHWLSQSGDDETPDVDGEVARFLDPKSLRELRSGEWEAQRRIQSILTTVIAANSPRAWEVVEKTRDALQSASVREGGENRLSTALRSCISDDGEPRRQCFAIALTLHAAAVPVATALQVDEYLFSQLQQAGGALGRAQRDPVARMRMIADRLGEYVKPEESPLLLPVLAGAITVASLQNITREQNCDAIVAWAEGPGHNHPRQDIVGEIAAAARLAKFSDRRIPPRKFSGVATEAELPPEQQHFLNELRNEKLSLSSRAMLAAAAADVDPWQVGDSLVRDAVGVLGKAAQARIPVPLWQDTAIIELVAMREAAAPKDLASAALQATRAGRAFDRENDTDLQRRGTKAALRLALHIGDEAAASRIARTFGEMFDSQFLAIIARGGTPELMRSVLRPGRNELFTGRSTNGFTNEGLESDTAVRLEAVLTAVEQEDLRYMAKLAVAAIDSEDPDKPPPPVSRRLAALAQGFSKITFREVALRERALEILASQPESASIVAGPIRESLEGLSISTIAALHDEQARSRKRSMYFAAMAEDAARGDFGMLETGLRELLPQVKPGRDELKETAGLCLKVAGQAVLREWQKKPDVVAKACGVYRTALAVPGFPDKVQDWQETAQFTGVLHAMAGTTDELDAWWKALPPETRKSLEKGLASVSLDDFGTGRSVRYSNSGREVIPGCTVPEFTGDKDAAAILRDAVFLRFVATPLSGNLRSLASFESVRWGSVQEALRLEERWCSTAPAGGQTALRFAQYYGGRQEFAACLAAAERGLKLSGPGRRGVAGDLTIWKLWALHELKRSAAGRDLFFAAAQLPLPEDEEEDAVNTAANWRSAIGWMSTGPAEEAGSLAEAIAVAAMLFPTDKENAALWSRLQTAGIRAAEYLAGQAQPADASAAAAFALKAAARAEKLGAEMDPGLKSRTAAALSGAVPDRTLVSRDASWRWLESGSPTGENWRRAGYDDSAWKSGSGPFGFGDEGLKTEIANKDAGGAVLISWPFRTEFDVADPAAVKFLLLNLRVDDGCVVWLNGKEAGRRNMPHGEVNNHTLAPLPINQSEEGRLEPLALDPALLVKGRNAIAIDLHQQRPDSSDAAFHAELLYSTEAPAAPVDADKALQALAPLFKDAPEELRRVFMP